MNGKNEWVNINLRQKARDGGFAELIRPINSCGWARLQAETGFIYLYQNAFCKT